MAITVLSSRPDMVTGGDALLAVSSGLPSRANLIVNVNGKPGRQLQAGSGLLAG
jgi:hypothetical protein